ncbi:MAG: NUDIX domain-containing protein [Eubacteriales bacterium]|jgi:8-oxo-dGTP pyrophosphatase MutT (NUDIX family)|nr:NUDIX domain-containing protein [Eubacteriales bacterium]
MASRRRKKNKNSQERLTAYNEKMYPIGDYPRSHVHRSGMWHKVAQCWIIGVSRGNVRVYLQRRSYEKKSNPGKYDISSGGHVSVGERPAESMVRELREETGIIMKREDLIPVGAVPEISGKDHEMAYEYVSFQNDPPFRPGDEVIYMVSADIDDYYKLCRGELDSIDVIPAIRTGPMLRERFSVKREDFCLHDSFIYVIYPFVKDFVRPFIKMYEDENTSE